MATNSTPETRIGKLDGIWTVAIADQFGWVKAGAGDALPDELVETWTVLVPRTEPRIFLPGEEVPAGVRVIDEDGQVSPEPGCDDEPWSANYTTVEILNAYEWEEIVSRAERRAVSGTDPSSSDTYPREAAK